jgi:HK97 family phage portal protein
MGYFRNLMGAAFGGPRAAVQSADGGTQISNSRDLETAIRQATTGTGAGVSVTPMSSMQVSAVYASVRILAGAVANMPLNVKRRVSDKERQDASEESLWGVLRRRPNNWQTPSQFKRMMTVHMILRGNAYALIAWSMGRVVSLTPLHPDRMEVKQDDDGTVRYIYQRRNGTKVVLDKREVFHLIGMSFDGITGVSAIEFARGTIGLALALERHGSTTFRNSARPSVVLKHPGQIGPEALNFLKASLDDYRSGGDSEGKALILEEGMSAEPLQINAQDAQWIEGRGFSRVDIAMFMGVPPSMLGDNSGSDSNWGSGLEQKSVGFVTYSLEDYLTTWEETCNRDLVPDDQTDIYTKFNRASLLRGDAKTRWENYVKAMQWGAMSPDEVRELEDMNPREDGLGGKYYDPPNTAGTSNGDQNDPQKTA